MRSAYSPATGLVRPTLTELKNFSIAKCFFSPAPQGPRTSWIGLVELDVRKDGTIFKRQGCLHDAGNCSSALAMAQIWLALSSFSNLISQQVNSNIQLQDIYRFLQSIFLLPLLRWVLQLLSRCPKKVWSQYRFRRSAKSSQEISLTMRLYHCRS